MVMDKEDLCHLLKVDWRRKKGHICKKIRNKQVKILADDITILATPFIQETANEALAFAVGF